MTQRYEFVQGDNPPPIAVTINDDRSALTVDDVTSVTFTLVKLGSGSVMYNQVPALISGDNPAGGVDVYYDWQEAETLLRGIYLCRFTITLGDGTVVTAPSTRWDQIAVT